MEARNDNGLLCHVVRLQEEGLSLQAIQGWFERFDNYGVDVEGLASKATMLTPAERTALVKQSRRITQQMHVWIAFGSAVGTFVIGWIFVGIASITPLLDGFMGGAIGAGMKVGSSIIEMLKARKPVSVVVGGIIGWLLLVVTYLTFIGGVTGWDLVKAILLWLLSSWFLWQAQANVGKEGGCIAGVVLSLIYFGLVYLVVSW